PNDYVSLNTNKEGFSVGTMYGLINVIWQLVKIACVPVITLCFMAFCFQENTLEKNLDFIFQYGAIAIGISPTLVCREDLTPFIALRLNCRGTISETNCIFTDCEPFQSSFEMSSLCVCIAKLI